MPHKDQRTSGYRSDMDEGWFIQRQQELRATLKQSYTVGRREWDLVRLEDGEVLIDLLVDKAPKISD